MAVGQSTAVAKDADDAYEMRISRLTIDKLGVKLYDKASAVIAELLANAFDADATKVRVEVPLGTELASKRTGEVIDKGFQIIVTDNGHGMTPEEAQAFYLKVGTDRRMPGGAGARSRGKKRPVMGRKGIGKLSPFGICRRIEVLSAGGDKTEKGFLASHFILDFDKIVRDEDEAVPIPAGPKDRTYQKVSGTVVRLTTFLPKRVPDENTFMRQLAQRFSLSATDFEVEVQDTRHKKTLKVPKLDVQVVPSTKIDLADRPVEYEGATYPVSGWLALGRDAYKNEEESGVRIYARGKIVATTRDFEQPAGYTGEFTMRSYLVGEVHAEWLDNDEGDDLIRTDRQGILWDSDLGDALRKWGAKLIREIGAASKKPRREKKSRKFMERADIERRARERYGDAAVVKAAVELGKQIGAFASEDELDDEEYVGDLAEVILTVAPHQALIEAFKEIGGNATIDEMLDLFGRTRTAEIASYGQIASERVRSIEELQEMIFSAKKVDERDLQALISRAPWLVSVDWTVLSEDQALKTFRDAFVVYWRNRFGEDLDVAISYEKKRPDFTMISIGLELHVVELKPPGHVFTDADYDRLQNYLEAFEEFYSQNTGLGSSVGNWVIDLIADKVNIKHTASRRAFEAEVKSKRVVRQPWNDFLLRARTAHGTFMQVHDKMKDTENGDG